MKLELQAKDVRFLLSDDVPSIRTGVRLRSGVWIDFFGIHPRPPDPGHDSDGRDAEILLISKEMRQTKRPAIVAGDLNDVAWCHTTRLFQRVSGALDPRRGRGMFNTFHAGHMLLRWPLDHIFHDASFTLVDLKRLPNIGQTTSRSWLNCNTSPKPKRCRKLPMLINQIIMRPMR